MQKLVKDYLNELKKQRQQRRRAGIAVVLLAAMVISGVVGILTQYGVAMTGQAKCGLEEHSHVESCYEQAWICGLTEGGEGHSHGDACYEAERVLSCTKTEGEGHSHSGECYETKEASVLACGLKEGADHTHADACYQTESSQTLICTLEEGSGHIHGDGCYSEEQVLSCTLEESEGHAHSESCQAAALVCEKEEHTHTDGCYGSDGTKSLEETIRELIEGSSGESTEESAEETTAEAETEAEDKDAWDRMYAGIERREIWSEDLAAAAALQLGYKESAKDYIENADGSRRGYTRYGALAGEEYKYEKWDAAFVNFCLYYAGLTETGLFPAENDSAKWREAFCGVKEGNDAFLTTPEGYEPQRGDLAFFEEEKEGEEPEVRMGIVSTLDEGTNELKILEGDSENAVRENTYAKDDPSIAGYLKLTELEASYKGSAEPLPKEEEAETEEGLTEEELAQIEEVIARIEALPSPEEVMEKIAALDEAGDEEGYEAYYLELLALVSEAQAAYDALNAEQQAAVTNIEKLLQYAWLEMDTLEETLWDIMKPDEAYVNEIRITGMETGSSPFDAEEGRGNDTTPDDKLVRTFDTVIYHFNVNMKTWDISKSYGQARVKLEFVLPLSEEEAAFEQTSMGWMDQAEGYKPVVTEETRIINGVETKCQVLTCYKLLLPSEGNHSVVPGDFGENLTIYVGSMKNGAKFAPIISAAMEGGAWDGPCDKEGHTINGEPAVEKKTVTPEEVEVTAAPKYNIQVEGNSSYADDFCFQGDEAWMEQYKDIAANTDIVKPLPGRSMVLGITLQLYNDNPSKGLKGIELPDGSPITFDLKLSSTYKLNTPNEGYSEGQIITDSNYGPLLWSYNEVDWKEYGSRNKDGRQIDDRLKATPYAPYNKGTGNHTCHDGGSWTAKQEGDTIHITVEGYKIDPKQMPSLNADQGTDVTYGANIGCFSAGEIWLVQPFNKKEGEGKKPNFDIVTTYGQGFFATKAEAGNLQITTASGEKLVEGVNGFQQMVAEDDEETRTLELTLGGALRNRVRYADAVHYGSGCGISDNRDGRDFAAVGSEINLMGGLSYTANREEENRMYLGTTLLKFYGTALEIRAEDWFLHLEGGASLNGFDENNLEEAQKNVRFYYATKKDGSDWKSDEELKTTYEDSLVFYDSLDKIPAGKICVGMLICFIGPGGEAAASDPYYRCYHKASVRDNMELAGQTYMLASTSRVWTKRMFEEAKLNLEDIDPQANPQLNVPALILEDRLWNCGHYTSANIDGSVFYTKETYSPDGSGIIGTHNSDWYHWGDTLLIIGYKTKITKNLLQKDENGNEKKAYSLDADQRVADFVLQPATYYDQIYNDKPNQFANTAQITIVDTLPKHMTYKPGSAYFGGTYEQTSILGGTKGNIIVDSSPEALFPDPVISEPSVTNNADGTQTLTWVIDDVKIGTPMPPIYYSADIGVRGNPEQDITIGTNNLTNVAYITTPYDLRDPATTAEKHAEAGIIVTRGSASSFGKYTKQKVVDEDGDIDYVVYFNNNADTGSPVKIMDTMPMNEVSGSHFTGSYTFVSWKLDISKCKKDNLKIYYTFDTQYQDKTISEVKEEEIKDKWTLATINEDGSINLPTESDGATPGQPYPVAWVVIGTLDAHQSVSIDLRIQLDPGSSDKDKTENNYFVNRLSSGDTTTITETPTVRRTLEGLTFMDYNRDGLQDEPQRETRISGVRVELLKLREGDPEAEDSYENVCYPGTTDPIIIETGQQISVRAESAEGAIPYETGRYKFTDLPAGTFAVRFTDGDVTKISSLNPTKQNIGEDDTRDSDGQPVYEEDGKLKKTVILNIMMPRAEEMSVSLYQSKYHDSGFYPDTQIKIQKVNEKGTAVLQGAIFTIQDSNGRTMSFTYEEGKGYTPFIEEETDPALEGKFYIAYAANTDYVVEIEGAWSGALPKLQKRSGNPLQLFEVRDMGGDLKAFLNVGSGKWLDLDKGSLWNGAKIHVWDNNAPNDNQTWHVTDCGGGFHIWPKGNEAQGTVEDARNWRMDLNGGSPNPGTPIMLWKKNDSEAQKWVLIPAAGSSNNGEGINAKADLAVDNEGYLTIRNLIPGDYTITEIKSPEGYSLLREPLKFTLNTNGNITTESGMAIVEIENEGNENSISILKVKNEKLYELPKTGGSGTFVYTVSGTLLMMAGALVLYKKKMRGGAERVGR